MKSNYDNTKKQSYIAKGFKVMYSCGPFLMVITFILILVLGLNEIVNLLLLRNVLNIVINSLKTGGKFDEILPWVIGMVLALILFPIINKLVELLKLRLNQKINIKAKLMISNKLKKVEYINFENKNVYDLCKRMEKNSEKDMANTVFNVAEFCKNVISTILLSLIIIKIAWWALPVSFATVLPMILVKLKREEEQHKAEEERAIYNRMAKYISGLITDKSSTKEVRIFNNLNYLQKKWENNITESDTRERKIQTKAAKHSAVINMIYAWAGSPVSLFILYCVSKKYITFADYMILGKALNTLGLLVTYNLSNSFGSMRRSKYFWEDFDKFLNIKEQEYKEEYAELNSVKELRFENVYFTYPGCEKPVLNGVSFCIRQGEKLVVVGENGAGKSTIIKLALGLYKPDSGSVSINGRSVYDMRAHERQKLLSCVFQDYTKYQVTVRENIGFGNIKYINDDEKITKAAKKGLSYDIINSMPQGYDTLLGNVYGEGADLSEGQWQKICISRAFLSDAKIMILDEPSAALDPKSETELYQSFIRLAGDKMCILISHRLGSAKIGDRILVVEDGKIIENGTHAELMKQKKQYYKMFMVQSEWYREENIS